MDAQQIMESLEYKAEFTPASKAGRDDDWECFTHQITISNRLGGTAITTPYSQGIGHLPFNVNGPRTINLDNAIKHAIEHGKGPSNGRQVHSGTFTWKTPLPKPAIEDVMASLLMDASCVDEDFEGFCSNMGYDTDSRKAETIYEAYRTIDHQLRRLLTTDQLETLQAHFEDY